MNEVEFQEVRLSGQELQGVHLARWSKGPHLPIGDNSGRTIEVITVFFSVAVWFQCSTRTGQAPADYLRSNYRGVCTA